MASEDVELRLSLKERQQVARGLQDTTKDLEQVADAGHDVAAAGDKAAASLEKASDPKWGRRFGVVAKGAKSVVGVVGRGLARATKTGAVALGALTVATAAAGYGAIQLAGDARETASAFDTVFDKSAGKVQKRLDRLTEKFGVYNPVLQDSARQFGVFGKAAGIAEKQLPKFATSLTKAGLDLASFYNVSNEEALAAIQSGLSGEAEPLRRFGIFLSDATMKAEAATMGLGDELTESQKVMVRQRLIMKGLGDANKDLARTSNGLSNQQKAAGDRVKTFLTMAGGPLATAATGAFRGFNKVAQAGIGELQKRIPGLESGAESLSDKFERWGTLLADRVPGAVDKGIAKWNQLRDKWGELRTKWEEFKASGDGDSLASIGSNLSSLTPLVTGLSDNMPTLTDALTVFDTITGFLADNIDLLAKALPFLAAGWVLVKTAQFAANIAAAASPAFKILDYIATKNLTKALKDLARTQGVAGKATGIASGVTVAQTGATVGATGAQKGLNAAMKANPLGVVLTAVTLLVGGFLLLYDNSETVRTAVDGLWKNILKPFGRFLKGTLLGAVKIIAKMFLTMGAWGIRAFSGLLSGAFAAFDGILTAADKGLGWVPGLGDKISNAKQKFTEFGDSTITKLDEVATGLEDAKTEIDALGKKKATPEINYKVTTTGTIPPGAHEPGASQPHRKYLPDDLPPRATGGPVTRGRTYRVGERGEELFTPSSTGRITPAHTTARLLQREPLRVESASDIAASLDADASVTVGPSYPGGPITIQVVLDGKVLGETVLDSFETKAARR